MRLFRARHYLKKVKTPLLVIASHLILVLLTVAIAPKNRTLSLKKTPLTIREHVVSPPKPQIKRPPKPKAKKVTRKKKKKRVVKQKPKQKKSRDLMAQLDASLAKIEKQSQQINFSKSTSVPSNVRMHTDHSALAAYFSERLELPEIGDVTVTFAVQPNGKIVRIKVLSSRSLCNEKYLLQSLKGMTLPNLGSEESEFTVTFCGEG